MRESEILDLEANLEAEYQRNMEAIRRVKSMLAQKDGIAISKPSADLPLFKGSNSISKNHRVEGETKDKKVIWLMRNIGKDFLATDLFDFANSVDPKHGLTMPDISNSLWKIGKDQTNERIREVFQRLQKEDGARQYYRYVGG